MEISLFGTGLMGQPMGFKLLEAGHTLTAYNRTPEKLIPLQNAGATVVHTPQEALQASSVSILMLTNAQAIQDTLLSDSSKSALAGHTIIQMSTIAPQESKDFKQQIETAGGNYLEAPVLGSIPEVKKGELQVMVGGTPEQFQTWQNILQVFGKPLLMGEVGAASTVKVAMNQLIGSLVTAFSLSLSLVQKEGIDVDKFMEIVRGSSLYAPKFDSKLKRMLQENFDNPNFPTKHLLKDMQIVNKTAENKGVSTDATQGVERILERALALGLADSDYSALFQAVKNNDRKFS
ncbi:NAD(P)-dependent oxidoreductase [Spirulina sp. CS-785/01]|uniref:NAD(P)-dependent oxidoreductase n=1 Tax=Spirulina sp. CS-785/01 TaxID=3021716 RepID=UPI00232BE571|nr:NAD(P)-dependent oxidoreductase [Spirulina sp. CS-785/01]MDB9314306.1 NAD(P)-dependent oxidoreductase [Spirulina sp. CS-785/01]